MTKTVDPPIYDPPPPPPTFAIVAAALLAAFGILHAIAATFFEAPEIVHLVLSLLEVASAIGVAAAIASWRKAHRDWATDVSSRFTANRPAGQG